jgi:hypothetical protein
MKKILLLFILFIGVFQLKAQQLFQVKPTDNLTNNLLGKYFQIKPGEWQLLQPQLNINEVLSAINTQKLETVHIADHMPIAVLAGYSKMPIVKLGGYYTMPVKKIDDAEQLLNRLKVFQFEPLKPFIPALQPERLKLLNSY